MKTNSIDQDNEFYILQGKKKKTPFYKRPRFWIVIVAAQLVISISITMLSFHRFQKKYPPHYTEPNIAYDSEEAATVSYLQAERCEQQTTNHGPKFCESQVFAYNGFELKVFQVVGGTASLQVGPVDTNDSTILLAVRAADVREDNGGIVGAFVDKGQLLSQGKAKKGFCAIINGKITIGAAENSPFLEDAINNGGYSLVEDYRLLWQYTNELTAPDYPFVKDLADQGKYWAGNGNKEQMFQVQFMNAGSWNGNIGMGFTNMASLYCGLRCDDDGAGHKNGDAGSMPFGQGWGQGTINANLWDDWSDSDPRKKATILDAPTELSGFVFTTSCSEDAGYYNKKWMPVTCSGSSFDDFNKYYTWWGVYRNSKQIAAPNDNSFQGDHFTDIVLLRLADVMLMHSELTGTADQMNKVRARAGLPATTYSWQNIKNERRWELAAEGIRFNDLRRWSGKGGGESCEAAQALERQNGSRVNYTGRWTTMHHATSSWAKRYAETDGFLMIPPSQILITNDESVLKQNAGWGASVSDANMAGTPVY